MSLKIRSALKCAYELLKCLDKKACFTFRNTFLAHRIRISEILSWDRKSYLTHAIFYPGCHVRATYIGCIGTHAHCCPVTL